MDFLLYYACGAVLTGGVVYGIERRRWMRLKGRYAKPEVGDAVVYGLLWPLVWVLLLLDG